MKSPASGRPLSRASSPPVSAAFSVRSRAAGARLKRASSVALAVGRSTRSASSASTTVRPSSLPVRRPARLKLAASPSTSGPSSICGRASRSSATGGSQVGSSGSRKGSSLVAGEVGGRRESLIRSAPSALTSSRPRSRAVGDHDRCRPASSSQTPSGSAIVSRVRRRSNGTRPSRPTTSTRVSGPARARSSAALIARWPGPVCAKAKAAPIRSRTKPSAPPSARPRRRTISHYVPAQRRHARRPRVAGSFQHQYRAPGATGHTARRSPAASASCALTSRAGRRDR